MHSHIPSKLPALIFMQKMLIELYNIVKELIGAIADVQLRLEELEEDSHPPVNWEEIIRTNVERIEHLERKLIERDGK